MGYGTVEHLSHQPLPPVRIEPGTRPAARAHASGAGVCNPLSVSVAAPSHLCGLHFGLLGGAAHDSGPPVLCHRNYRLHLCRHLVRRARPHRVLRRPLSAVLRDRRHAVSEDPYCLVAQRSFALRSTGGDAAMPPLPNYQHLFETSQRVNWRLEDLLGEGRRLDFTRPFLPETFAQTEPLGFLSAAEKLKLNQIRARGYLALF